MTDPLTFDKIEPFELIVTHDVMTAPLNTGGAYLRGCTFVHRISAVDNDLLVC